MMRSLTEMPWIFRFFSLGTGPEIFRDIVEAAPNAIVLVGRDGKIVLINAQTEKMFGYARKELIGKPIEILVPERYRATHPGHRGGYFISPSVRSMGAGRDLFGLRKDGKEVPVEIGLNPIHGGGRDLVLASIIDITERKRAEERFRRVVESAPNAIILVGEDGLITLVNAQTEKLFGYPREELVGMSIDKLVPERFRSMHGGFRSSFFASPSVRSMGAGRDLFGLRKDGREFPVEIGLNPIQSEEGNLVLTSVIDITERKRAEAGMSRLLQEMQETVTVLAASTSDILDAASQVASGSTNTATAVSETTSTVEEVKQTALMAADKARHVSESAQRTAEISQHGKKSVAESVDAMRHIQGQMESVAESIIRLSEQSQTIGEIIATVNDLAEQSNLLAVNAAIEAAKAGEQGKGFAVVAQEVKSLAGQSKQATTQVRAILGEIQKATNAAVMATEQGSKAVESGVRLSGEVGQSINALAESIEEAARAATQIAVSAQQQLIGMDQAVMAIKGITQAARLNVDSAGQAKAAAENIHTVGQKLKQLMERS
ncbi:MAG TPA: PAS domain S-box protein [Methylophilaceae bacterium]|nr:PAS domain S-box protein [Methylophilaceae bacterium]